MASVSVRRGIETHWANDGSLALRSAMGSLKTHDVDGLVAKHDLSAFVETGLYKGEGLAYAAQFPQFEKLVSIDILEQWITRGQKTFAADARVTLLLGNSYEVMPGALREVEGLNVLWWLDAHLPEACIANRMTFKGNEIYDDDTTFPLAGELEIITTQRDFSGDVFLLDDLRIYENGEYTWGNWKTKGNYNDPGTADFVDELLGDTHNVTRGNAEHGFIIATPK